MPPDVKQVKSDSRAAISLVRGKKIPSAGAPLLFRPGKDSPWNLDSHSQQFDSSLMRLPTPKRTGSRVDISLPYESACAISAPMVPARTRLSELDAIFNEFALSTFFRVVEEEEKVEISREAQNLICATLKQNISNVIRGAVQESRRSTNYYARPVVEREYTSCPLLSHKFLILESFYGSYLRRSVMHLRENYEPVFYCDESWTTWQAFKPDVFANEGIEQKYERLKIYQSLKHRGNMFKAVAREDGDKTFVEETERLYNNFKNPVPTRGTAAFNPMAQEVFGNADVERQRLSIRAITGKDIIAFLSACGRGVRTYVPDLILEKFSVTSD